MKNRQEEINAAVADAQNRLAMMYKKGDGIQQSEEMSKYWFAQAQKTISQNDKKENRCLNHY